MATDRGVAPARRRAVVVGGGEVAGTFAARLAYGGCDVERAAADIAPPAAGGAAPDAVVLADGRELDGVELGSLDLAAWAPWALASVRAGGVVVLVGGDGRLLPDGEPGGPWAIIAELGRAADPSPARLNGVLLRELRAERTVAPTIGPGGEVGAVAAEAVEYLCSARSQALTGALLRAPLRAPGPAHRSGADERRVVRATLAAAAARLPADASH